MTLEDFDEVLVKELARLKSDFGYNFYDSCFFLNRKHGLRNLIAFDFDGKSSFRIIVGINYPYDSEQVDISLPPDGARLCYFFSGGSLVSQPRDFRFKAKSDLQKHLGRFFNYFVHTLDNEFFASVNTPEQYADSLGEDECIAKFEIYKKIGSIVKAGEQAEIVIDRYMNMTDIPKIFDYIDKEIKPFLEKIKIKIK